MDDLTNLAGLAAEADAGAAPAAPPGQEGAATEPTRNDQAADLVKMFSGLVIGYVPETASVLNEAAQLRCAIAIAPVLEKYNFSMDALPCELVAAVIVGPVIYSAGKIVVAKFQAERAQAAAPGGARSAGPAEDVAFRPPAPPSDVAPAAAMHPQMALYANG